MTRRKSYFDYLLSIYGRRVVHITRNKRLRLLMLHIWSYGGPCHEVVNGEDYWHSIYGRTVVHVTKLQTAKITGTPYMVVRWSMSR